MALFALFPHHRAETWAGLRGHASGIREQKKGHFLATAETLIGERDYENQFYSGILTPNDYRAIP